MNSQAAPTTRLDTRKPRLYHNRMLACWVCYSEDQKGYRHAGHGDTPTEAFSVWRARCAWLRTR